MNFFRKIVLLSGILFLFCLAQSENKSQNISILETQNDSYLRQNHVNSSYFIQPATAYFTVISSQLQTPCFALLTAVFFTLRHVNTSEVAKKAFSFKSINRVPTVSFLLYPVHYFW